MNLPLNVINNLIFHTEKNKNIQIKNNYWENKIMKRNFLVPLQTSFSANRLFERMKFLAFSEALTSQGNVSPQSSLYFHHYI